MNEHKIEETKKEEKVKKWGEFADPNDGPLPGRKARAAEYLDKEIIVLGFRILASKKREDSECLCLQIKLDGEIRIIFTGSTVLIKQIRKYSEHLPFSGKIIKIEKYLTFADAD